MKKLFNILLVATTLFVLNICAYAAETSKDYTVSVPKEYNSAKITVSVSDDADYEATAISPDGKSSFEGKYVDSKTLEIIINTEVRSGDWTVRVKKTTEDEPVEEGAELPPEADISGVSIKFEGSTEQIIDVNKDIVVATDIVGLQMYFKDDSFVAEWTDTTCGDVLIEVTDEKTMESLAKETVKERYFELPLKTSVDAIVVKIVPKVSAQIDGAEKQYTFPFVNDPDAVVTYEDIEITNKDSIRAHVVLNQPYSLLMMNNGKETSHTDTLDAGEYDFDLPTEVGDNQYLIYVVDDKHNMRSTAGYVEKDVVAPILQLVKEYTQIYTEDESIVFEGKVEDYDFFTINDAEVKVEGDHTFKYEYGLKEGENIVNILAEDRAGNQSLYRAAIYRIIPEEKPIPWDKIIPGAIILVLVISYLIDSIRKNFAADDNKLGKNAKKNAKKSGKNGASKATKKMGTKGLIIDIIELAAPLLALYLIITFVIQVSTCESGSMEPNIMTGNTVFYNRLAYVGNREIQRGDVVSFWSDESNKYFCKRVIGLPGDEISFKDGYVVINGQYVDESAYIDENVETNSQKTFTVPDNCYFLLGDNRENSADARFWLNPYISRDKIAGKYMGQLEFSIKKNILHTL